MPWIGAAVGVVGNAIFSGGGGGGGGGSQYAPGHLAAADDSWQNSNQNSYNLAEAAYNAGIPGYDQSFDRANGLDWSGFLDNAGRAGAAYGRAGDVAMGQMGQYGQGAQASRDQQAAMYGAAGRVLDTAFDPQGALYGRTAQRLTDQVRAGQAARGLGNSEVGAMEEAGAMSNFNIDWQNAQLGRQATGIQAAGGATGAGVNAGRMAGADMSAELAAGGAGAGYYGQAGTVPMSMQQQWAAAPGQAAAQLQGGYSNLQQGFGAVAGEAIPYMNAGQGALQANWQNNYQANRDMASGMAQFGGAVAPSIKGWFSGGGNGNAGTDWSNSWGAAMNGSGTYGDVAYG